MHGLPITDWDKWMKDHHIYIPTVEEIRDAQERNERKIRKMKSVYDAQQSFEVYKRKIIQEGG